jgi:hypothetical protein
MAISNEQVVALFKKNPVVSVAVILCLAMAGALYYRSDAISIAGMQLEEKTAEGKRLSANIKNSAQLPEQLARVTAASKEANSRLVRVGQLADNLQYFYKLEAETGVKFLDLRQTTDPVRAAKTGKIPVGFTLTVQGDYPLLFEFLRRLESGSHYCRVKAANVVTFDQGAGAGGLRSDASKITLNLELLGVP